MIDMCGIFALLKRVPLADWNFQTEDSKKAISKALNLLVPRGPDEHGVYHDDHVLMAHTRLAIVEPEAGPQPIEYKQWVVAVNGEIYNNQEREDIIETDCALIPKLLDTHGVDAIPLLDGVFSFVAYHRETREVIVARDAIGVTPLYWSKHPGLTIVSSLLATISRDTEPRVVPPGYVARFKSNEVPVFKRWFHPYNPWSDLSLVPAPTDMVSIMTAAVEKRLMGDVPWGVLLSGGLDSTIVATLAAAVARELRPDYPRVHTFCIGLRGSPDLEWAAKVAQELDTVHVPVEYTAKEGLQFIPSVVCAVETYDVTTIRASTPMWLLGRALKRRGIKMVLSGEGSDELFAGYLYNRFCPSETDMVVECTRKMVQLHAYDCQRANKALGDSGVEARVPFLDKQVVDLAMNRLHPRYKMSGTHPDGPKPEKWWLRDTFRDIVTPEVIDRTKAQFSDAVGSEWIRAVKAHTEKLFSDEQLAQAAAKYPYNTPTTKEALWYREIFTRRFDHPKADQTVLYTGDSIACSTGQASKWHASFQEHLDPSGESIHRDETSC